MPLRCETFNGLAPTPLLPLRLWLVMTWITAGVAGAPIGQEFEQKGPSAGPALCHCALARFIHGEHVIAVDRLTVKSVSRGAVRDSGVAHNQVDTGRCT